MTIERHTLAHVRELLSAATTCEPALTVAYAAAARCALVVIEADVRSASEALKAIEWEIARVARSAA